MIEENAKYSDVWIAQLEYTWVYSVSLCTYVHEAMMFNNAQFRVLLIQFFHFLSLQTHTHTHVYV